MTIKKNEDTGPGGKMVTTTESDVVRAAREPELLNHEEAKRAAEPFKKQGGAYYVKKKYSDAYSYYMLICFLKNASCYGGWAVI